MRNLKRALSLALTAVMVLGMMVIGAGAVSYDDFSDKDKIVNTEAVSTLVSLGVIAGKDDGSYDPSGIVTRAEMAKMICVVLNGGKDPQLGTVSSYTYSDTVTSWAAAYIEYCTTLGIVAGDGTGKFNPTATVTGAQAAKMLLVAAGYQAAIQGYTGANWANAVNVDANGVGLYDDLSINPSAGLSRDDAAQMVYNALSAEMVSYSYTLVSDGQGGFASIPTLKDDSNAKTVLESKFGVVKLEGVVVSNEYASSTSSTATEKDGQTELMLTTADETSNTAVDANVTVKTTTSADLLGKSVTVFAKTYKNGAYQTVIGTPVVSDDNVVVTVTANKDDITSAMKDGGIKSIAAGAVVVSNFLKSGTSVSTMGDLSDLTGNGIAVTAISNDGDSKADYILVTKEYAGKVSAYNAKGNDGDGYISVTSFSNDANAPALAGETFDDVDGYADVAKDDIVLYYEVAGTFYVEKAESVNVTVSSTSGTNTIKDGTTSYKQSALSNKFNDDQSVGASTYVVDAVTLGDDATLYLDNYGYVIYTDAVATDSQYMYITGSKASADSGFETLTIKAVLSDGTTVTADVAKLDGTKLATKMEDSAYDTAAEVQTYVNGAIATYTTSGSSYNITVKSTVSATSITKGTATLGSTIANSSTLFLVRSTGNDTYKAYTGISSVPSVASATVAIYAKSGIAKFAVAVGTLTGESKNDVYILSSTVSKTLDGDDTVYSVPAVVDGKYVSALTLSDYSDGNTVTKGAYSVAIASDNSVALADLGSVVSSGKVTRCSSGVIANGVSTLVYDDDTVVVTIDGTTVNDSSIDEVVYLGDGVSSNSTVVLVEGTNSSGNANGHADYVYIIL